MKSKWRAIFLVLVLGIAITLAILAYATQKDRFESQLVNQAQNNSTLVLEPAEDVEWTHGFVVCPYMPLSDIPQEFRSKFSDSKLLNDGSQWIVFATTQGPIVEDLSSSVLDFCTDNSGQTFEPGQTWAVHTKATEAIKFTLQH